MEAPPYHLRTNKAVDRHLFMESIRLCMNPSEISSYTYYGLGGPYMEDFRVFHEQFPGCSMVSIEYDKEVLKRQNFHKPSRKIELVEDKLGSYLNLYTANDEKSIFWLDYTSIGPSCLLEFALLIGKVTPGSIVKVTLKAQPKDYFKEKDEEEFKEDFSDFLVSPGKALPTENAEFCRMIQEMLRALAQKTLAGTGYIFQILSSFSYSDKTNMYTLTGRIHEEGTPVPDTIGAIKDWKFKNLTWEDPKKIDVPILSTMERLRLQRLLPTNNRKLSKSLGYKISSSKNNKLMKNYAEFYRQYPYFIKGVP